MKVSKAVNLFLDYHKQNSQKKYDQGLRFAFVKIPGPFCIFRLIPATDSGAIRPPIPIHSGH